MIGREDIATVQAYLDRISEKKKKLDAYRPLQSAGLARLREELAIEWTYNSNSIEGNTLTLVETKMVVQDGITVGGKSLREHFEVVNHQEAIARVEELVSPQFQFSDSSISSIHFLVLKNIMPDFAGRYRTSGVRITGANFTPPNALKVYDLMNELIEDFNAQIPHFHPVVLATWFHHQFVWIHPYTDGNGRTVRLVDNLFLMSMGYPPAIILKADRKKYYAALNAANKEDYSKLLLLMCQAAERSLDIYLSNIENYAEDYQPISNIVKDESVPYGQEYVSLLARRGKIDAYKEGKNWYTTAEAVLDYISKRERKRELNN
ncbi:MAG: hypothetical protein RLZZ337_3 [Bacteroidota bacterium]